MFGERKTLDSEAHKREFIVINLCENERVLTAYGPYQTLVFGRKRLKVCSFGMFFFAFGKG